MRSFGSLSSSSSFAIARAVHFSVSSIPVSHVVVRPRSTLGNHCEREMEPAVTPGVGKESRLVKGGVVRLRRRSLLKPELIVVCVYGSEDTFPKKTRCIRHLG